VKVKLDENLPAELLDDLRAAGHEADTVRNEGLTGSPDAVILERVRQDRRALFTLDKGIADIRAYPPEQHAGIVLFRPPSMGRGTTLAFVRSHLQAVLKLDLSGHLVVVTDLALRLR
jgi:predicted nuclease of predicted toxin-antitoxin system